MTIHITISCTYLFHTSVLHHLELAHMILWTMSRNTTDENPTTNHHWKAKPPYAPRLSINLSRQKLLHPNWNSRNQIHFNGFNPKELQTFILQCKLDFRDQKDLLEDGETKVNSHPFISERNCTNCFEPTLLDLTTCMAYELQLFIMELENNFGTFDPEDKQKLNLNNSHAQESLKLQSIYQFQQLSHTALQSMLGVSALHYSSGSQNSEGVQTVAFNLCAAPTYYHASEYLYSPASGSWKFRSDVGWPEVE